MRVHDQPWAIDALCAQIDPDAWFPDVGSPVQEVKRVCQKCPVRLECLEWALEHEEQHGVWGGLSPQQRRKIRIARNQGKFNCPECSYAGYSYASLRQHQRSHKEAS